jgi:chemotaxis protein methyltransferase CheR
VGHAKLKVEARPELAEIEVELFLLALFRRYGYDLRGHDPELVHAHVRRRMREEEVATVSALTERLLREPGILERFLSQFNDPGGTLFGPAVFWRSLRRKVVPFLRTYPSVRLWQIGGRPEEVFSLAILLHEDLPRHVQIYATDIHDALLEAARSGALDARKISGGAREYRRSGGSGDLGSYFQRRSGESVLSDDLRRNILFASFNPVTDGPFQRCHLVLARTLFGPFRQEMRERAFRLIHESLIPLGFLALGAGEVIQESPYRDRYKEVSRAAGIFQKLGP